jgi:hypothetical protein
MPLRQAHCKGATKIAAQEALFEDVSCRVSGPIDLRGIT